jgi:hypothetical protein
MKNTAENTTLSIGDSQASAPAHSLRPSKGKSQILRERQYSDATGMWQKEQEWLKDS